MTSSKINYMPTKDGDAFVWYTRNGVIRYCLWSLGTWVSDSEPERVNWWNANERNAKSLIVNNFKEKSKYAGNRY